MNSSFSLSRSIFLCVLFLVWVAVKINAERFVLPDGRVLEILDPDAYSYYLNENDLMNDTVLRNYALFEMRPDSSLLCPVNYFIGKIEQELIVNTNVSFYKQQLLPNISHSQELNNRLHVVSYENDTGTFEDAPCPTIYRCLGFQACLFKFSNEFCKRDPAPDLRKMVLTTIHCFKNELVLQKNDQKRDHVLHLRYRSRLEEQTFKRDYFKTVISENQIPEEDVFGMKCPAEQSTINREGYMGECNTSPTNSSLMTEQTWKLFGRTKSYQCRLELFQVFCAYQYNSNGHCVPPIFLKQNNVFQDKIKLRKFNFLSLPQSTTEDEELLRYFRMSLNDHGPIYLGFLLLFHNEASTAISLLKQIWRPYHFYVVHIDKRSTDTRQDFHERLTSEKFVHKNVIVLPKERSFATSWGSYQIVRAQLEGIYELLRMGAWDFVVNLSGADLPLRDIDDFSAALRFHRGLNFFPFVHWKNNPRNRNDSEDLIQEAFHSCDDYVFKVSQIGDLPSADEFKVYNSPQWGVFSRNFSEYLVDEMKRSEQINKYQFYLQTHIIPDESYIATILMNSPFQSTFRQYAVHTSKEFASNNVDHLCRHSTDADFCGQGPAVFEEYDIPEIMSLSHRSFFARKFSSTRNDNARHFVLGLATDGYHSFVDTFLPIEVIKTLSEMTLNYLMSSIDELFSHRLVLEKVLKIRILPSLVPHDPCCSCPLLSGLRKMTDHYILMDIMFKDESGKNDLETCQIYLEPVINGRFCYPDGDLKMIFISTWTKDINSKSASDDDAEKFGLLETMPLPFGPAGIESISLSLIFVRGDNENFTCSGYNNQTRPLIINNVHDDIKLLLRLVTMEGETFCVKNETFNIESEENSQDSFFYVHTFTMNCGLMKSGPWILQIAEEVETPEVHIYNIPFYLLDYENTENLESQLPDMQYLWKVKKHFILRHTNDKMTTKSVTEKFHSFTSITIHPESLNFFRNNVLNYFQFIFSHGGLLAFVICCFVLHFRFYHKSGIPLSRRHILCYLLCFSIATVLQTILLLNLDVDNFTEF